VVKKNKNQVKFVEDKRIFIIQGPPGSGKTQLLYEIVYKILKLNFHKYWNHDFIVPCIIRLRYNDKK